MSRTIDEKVVEMRFDNSDFERNVSQSMSTLDKLKSALNFSGAEKAFDGISSAANKLDFGPLGGAIEGVGQKFSALETMAVGALMNIGATISNELTSKLKAVTIDQVTAGWDKYAEKTTSVQTIMNATGRSIDDVSEKLDTLNWFTDETSYNFTDMTNSIGKFTSQGIELEDAVTAMEGISTAAALAGQNAASASRVMYNFSQSLGMGAVKLQDWMSVENANMATEEFKQTIIDTAIELGRLDMYGNIRETKYALDELGNIQYDELGNIIEEAAAISDNYSGPAYANVQNFRNTLAAGWFDDKVLIASMKKFGGFAGRLNEVYEQFNENYDVTTSQILSWLNAYMDGTLDIEEAVKKTGLTAEEILPILEELSSEEYELGRRAFAAAQEAKTFEDVVNATADAVSTAWMNVFEKIFGNYEEARVTWTELANELWDIFAGPISNLNDLLTDWHDMGGRDDFIQSVKNMYGAVRSVLDPIGEAWEMIFPPKTADDIFNFTKRMREFTDSLIRDEKQMGQIRMVFRDFFGLIGDFTSGFANGGGFAGFFGGIGDIVKITNDRMQDFITGIQKVRKVITAHEEGNLSDSVFTRRLEELKEQYPVAYKLADIYGKISATLSTVGNTLGRLLDFTVFIKDGVFSFDTVIDGIVTKVAELLRGVTDIVHIWTGYDMGNTATSVLNFIRNMAEGIKNLVHNAGWEQVRDNIKGIGTAFTETFGGIRDFFGPAWNAAVAIFNDWLDGIGSIIGDTSDDFSGFFSIINGGLEKIQDFIRNNEGFSLFVNGIKDAIAFVSDFMTKFLSLTDAIEVYRANGGGIVGVLAVIHDKLKLVLDTTFDIIQNVTGFDIHSIGDGILQVIEGIAYGILKAADTISKAFGWVNNPFGKLLGVMDNGLGGPGEFNLGTVFENFGGVFQKLGDIIAKSSPLISAGIGFVSDLFKNLINLIPKIDVNTLIQIVQAIATIRLTISATDAFNSLSETLEAMQHKLKAEMLFAIAGAILAIAGAAFLIGQIDADKIGLVLGTLGTAFAGLIGTLVASKFGNAGVLAALPGAVLSLAGAMVIMAKAAGMMAGPIEAFSKIENFWENFAKLGAVMGAFLGLLGVLGAINSSGSVLGAAKAIRGLAGVLALMLPIVIAYSLVDAGAFADGLKQIAWALLELGGVLTILGLFESLLNGRLGAVDFGGIGNGLLKMAAALGVMVGILFVLTKIDGLELGAALLKLAGALLALVAGIAVFSFGLAILGPVLPVLDAFGSALLKLALALAVITAVTVGLGVLGKLLGDAANDIIESGVNMIVMAIDELADRAPELAEDIVLIALAILNAVAAHTPEIVSAAVQIIGGVVQGIREAMTEGGVNLMDLFVGTGVLAGLIGFVWVLKKMALNIGDFANAALALAGAGVLLLEIGAMFVGMGKLSALVGGPDGIKKFGEFASAMTEVFTSNWGVGALFVALIGFELLLNKIGMNTKASAKGTWGAFTNLISIITEASLVFDAIGALMGVAGGLVAGLDWVIEKLGGPEDGFEAAIRKFGEFAIAVADVIGGVVGHLLGSAVGGFAGETIANVMKGYAEGLGYIIEAGSSIGEFSTAAAGIESLSNMMLNLAKADFVEGITYWLGLTDGVDYEEFGNGLAALGPGIKDFADAITGLNSDDVEASVAVADMIMAFAEKVPESGGLIDFFTGKQDMKDFGEKLPDLATGLYNFAENIKGINSNAVEDAKTAVETIIELTRMIPENESKNFKVLWGLFSVEKEDQSIKDFSDGLSQLGLGLVTYSLYMEKIDSEKLKDSNSAVKNLIATIKKVVEVEDADKIKKYGEKLEKFGESLSKYSESISGINSVKMNSISQAIENAIDAFVGTDDANLLSKIDAIGNKVLTEITNLFISEDSETQAKTSIGVLIDYIADKFGEDASIAKLSTKISDMVHAAFEMEGFKNATKQAGLSLVAGIQNGITEGFDGETGLSVEFDKKLTTLETGIATDGPTGRVKMFYDAGLKLLNGFKNGLTFADNIELAKKAFYDFLDELLSGITSEERVGKFKGAGETLAGAITSGVKSDTVLQGAKDAGSYYVDGLAGSVTSGESMNKLSNAGATSGKAIMTGTAQSLDERSPSKVAIELGKYFTEGLALGIVDPNEIENVKRSTEELANCALDTITTMLEIHSPSWKTTLFGQFFTEGLGDGILEKIPYAVESVKELVKGVADGLDYESLLAKAQGLGLNVFGNLDETFQNYFSLHAADLHAEDLTSYVSNMMSGLSDGTIFSGSGVDNFYSYMSGFTDNFGGAHFNEMMGDAAGEISSFWGQFNSISTGLGTEGMESYLGGYSNLVENGTVANTVTGMTDTITEVCDDYAKTDAPVMGESISTSTLDSYIDGVHDMTPKAVAEVKSFNEAVTDELIDGAEKARDAWEGSVEDWFRPDYQLQVGAGQFRPVIDADAATVTYDGMTFQKNGELDAYLLSLDLQKQHEEITTISTDMDSTVVQNEQILAKMAELTEEVIRIRDETYGFRADMNGFLETQRDLQVNLDGRAVGSVVAPYVNRELGNIQILVERGI